MHNLVLYFLYYEHNNNNYHLVLSTGFLMVHHHTELHKIWKEHQSCQFLLPGSPFFSCLSQTQSPCSKRILLPAVTYMYSFASSSYKPNKQSIIIFFCIKCIFTWWKSSPIILRKRCSVSMITWSKGMESSGLWIDPFLESVVFPEQFLSHCSNVLSIGQSCTKSESNTILA